MLRKGDIVTLQGKVRWDVREDDKRVTLEIESAIDHISVDVSAVTVFQQEIRPGDWIKNASLDGWPVAKVIAIDGKDIFARSGGGVPYLWALIDIRRIDEEKEQTNGVD